MRKKNPENPNKSYRVYKVIVVLHIYNKILGIRLEGQFLQTKIKFDPYQVLSSICKKQVFYLAHMIYF